MAISKVKLSRVPRQQGRPTISDEVFARFHRVLTRVLKERGRGAQSQLARRLDLSPAAITQWLDETNRPDLFNVQRALRALDVSDDELATVLGADPNMMVMPQGAGNLAKALGVPEDLIATLWGDSKYGDRLMQLEETVRRAAHALMHIDGRTLDEVIGASERAVLDVERRETKGEVDSTEWDVLQWVGEIRRCLGPRRKSGQRESARFKAASGK